MKRKITMIRMSLVMCLILGFSTLGKPALAQGGVAPGDTDSPTEATVADASLTKCNCRNISQGEAFQVQTADVVRVNSDLGIKSGNSSGGTNTTR
jgi:hypothetical protein